MRTMRRRKSLSPVVLAKHYLLIVFLLAGGEGVLHQRTDGHGADTSGNRCDERALRSHLIELHVAIQAESALARCIRHASGTDIDNHSTLLYHVGCHKVWLTDGSDDNVGLTAFLFQRFRV